MYQFLYQLVTGWPPKNVVDLLSGAGKEGFISAFVLQTTDSDAERPHQYSNTEGGKTNNELNQSGFITISNTFCFTNSDLIYLI